MRIRAAIGQRGPILLAWANLAVANRAIALKTSGGGMMSEIRIYRHLNSGAVKATAGTNQPQHNALIVTLASCAGSLVQPITSQSEYSH